MTTHRYSTALRWSGSTAVGYEGYSRQHHLVVGGQSENERNGAMARATRMEEATRPPEVSSCRRASQAPRVGSSRAQTPPSRPMRP